MFTIKIHVQVTARTLVKRRKYSIQGLANSFSGVWEWKGQLILEPMMLN